MTPIRSRSRWPVLVLAASVLALAAGQALAAPATTLDRLNDELAVVARGFENSWQKDDVALAERVFDLEARGLEHLRRQGNHKFKSVIDRDHALDDVRAFLGRVFQLQERLWERGIDKIQAANPGEPDAILMGTRVDKYGALDRKFDRPGGPDVKKAVQEAKRKFDGPTVELSQALVDSLPKIARVTWVQQGKKIKLSADPKAKHLVMGGGKPANGAGDAFIIKNKYNDVLLFAIQYTSGSYKSGPASIEAMRQEVMDLGVPADRVMTTFSRPGSAGLVNLLLRAHSLDADVADQRQVELEAVAASYRTDRRGLTRSRLGRRPQRLQRALASARTGRRIGSDRMRMAGKKQPTAHLKPRRQMDTARKAGARNAKKRRTRMYASTTSKTSRKTPTSRSRAAAAGGSKSVKTVKK